MRDHLMLIRIRSDDSFNPARESVRSAIDNGLVGWGGGFTLVSLSPLPRDRFIKPRKSPERKDFPLLKFMEKPDAP
jgi:hypothetical protein